jgi:hypothetical protein
MRKFLIIALSLPSLGALTDIASAKPVVIRTGLHYTQASLNKECDQDGGTFAVEDSGKFSCVKGDSGIAINCEKDGSCHSECQTKACGNDNPRGARTPPKISGGTIKGVGSTTKLGGTSTGTSVGTATGANKAGGVMLGSTTSGGTTPVGTKGGGAGSVTAVTSNPTLNPTLPSTGGAFGSTRTGLGTGSIAGGIINGRKPQ